MNQKTRTGTITAAAFSLLATTIVAGCDTKQAAIMTDATPPAAEKSTALPANKDDGVVSVSPTGITKLKNPPPAESFGDLTALGGEKVSLASLNGKVIVLDFWATWCGPCRMTIPSLNALHEKYGKDGLTIVGISDETKEQVEPFVKEIGMEYTVVADSGDQSWKRTYGVNSLPTLVVIDRKGKVQLYEKGLDTTPGKGTEDRLKELLPQLLAEK